MQTRRIYVATTRPGRGTAACLGLCVSLLLGVAIAADPMPDSGANGTARGAASSPEVQSSIDVDARGGQGDTLLHWVTFEGNEEMVRRLIAAGANPNARVEKGSTPLHLAAYRGHTAIAGILIAHGAVINAKTDAGITPLDWAQRNGHDDMIDLLLANGATQGRQLPRNPSTASPAAATKAGVKRPARPGRPLRLDLDSLPELKSLTSTDNGQAAAAWRVQLGAFGSEKRAAAARELYREQHSELLSQEDLEIRSAKVNEKDFYRVQVTTTGRSAAQSLCDQLRRRDQPCRVIKSPTR
ncbi:MAG: ankyrin repeat domain-containing protein [Chromatiaceae bacterium]